MLHVPVEAQKVLGKTKFHQSTDTRDRKQAIEIWGRVFGEWRQQIRDALSGNLRRISDENLDRITGEYLESQGRLGWGNSRVDLATIRADFMEWAREEEQFVLLRTFDLGDAGEAAEQEILDLKSLTNSDFEYASTRILEGYVRFLERRSTSATETAGELSQKIAQLSSAHPDKISDGKVRLMDMFKRWKVGQRLEQTIEECRQSCEMFIEVNGDLAVDQFTRIHGVAFADHLAGLRARDGKELAPGTLAKRLSAVRAVFFIALERVPSVTLNPLSRVRIAARVAGDTRVKASSQIKRCPSSPQAKALEPPKATANKVRIIRRISRRNLTNFL